MSTPRMWDRRSPPARRSDRNWRPNGIPVHRPATRTRGAPGSRTSERSLPKAASAQPTSRDAYSRSDQAPLPLVGQFKGHHVDGHRLVVAAAGQHSDESAHHLGVVIIAEALAAKLVADQLFGPL